MKENCNKLCCPHCGARDFTIESDDVYFCQYCSQKFKLDLDNILLTNEDENFIDELKEKYYAKIAEFREQKKLSHACLLYYKKLANPQKLLTTAVIILVVSAIMLLAGTSIAFDGIYSLLIISAIGFAAGLSLFLFAKKRKKKMAEKYHPYIILFAGEVADYDEKIRLYSRFISRLTY